MGCILLLLSLLLPRLVLVIIFLFTNRLEAAYVTWLWPVLGFIFMPYTTLAYLGAMIYAGGVTPGWTLVIIVAVLVDIGGWGGGYRSRRRRAVVVRQ